MKDIITAIDSLYSISDFNKGKANQIFDSVRKNKVGIVVKNNKPECVLMSLDEYRRLLQKLEDAEDLALALTRLRNSDISQARTADQAFFDVSDESLKELDDIEFK